MANIKIKNASGTDVTYTGVNGIVVNDTTGEIESSIEFTEGAGSGKGLPTGGTTGQVLKKSSATDYNVNWYSLTEVAAEYSTSTTYSKGDYCIHDGVFYICSAETTTGTWDSSKWTSTSVGEELDDVQDTLLTKANIDGSYESLNAGTADQLNSPDGSENTPDNDSTNNPFLYRTSAGGTSISDGTALMEKLRGNTIVWNQTCNGTNRCASGSTITIYGVSMTNNGDGSITFSGTFNATDYTAINTNVNVVAGHKYILSGFKSGSSSTYGMSISPRAFQQTSGMVMITASTSTSYTWLCIDFKSGVSINETIKPILIDLTQMFGSGNEPTTVAEFKKYFPLDYYAYNAGTLLSANPTGMKTVGFNQWDEEWELGYYADGTGQKVTSNNYIRSKNKIKVFPSTTYYVKAPVNLCVYGFDANENYISAISYNIKNGTITTGANIRYIVFNTAASGTTTYNNDICINLSWSGYRNGEYEAYWTQTRSIDLSQIQYQGSALFPNGLCSAGSVYDEVTSTKAIKRVGKVDLGTLSWTKRDTTASGKYFYTSPIDIPIFANSVVGNILCKDYLSLTYVQTYQRNNGIGTSNNLISVYDSDKDTITSAEFKNAMSGIYVYYELATPIEVDIDPALNLTYKVSDFGTEQILPENTSSPTTAPLPVEILYQDNLRDKLRNLNELSSDELAEVIAALG